MSLVLLLAMGGCGDRVPTPVAGSHQGHTPVAVPYPPPAARSELIPPPPNENAMWVDGYWIWKGTAYTWNGGRWVEPGPGMVYAPPTLVRLRSGELLYYAPRWRKPARSDEEKPPEK